MQAHRLTFLVALFLLASASLLGATALERADALFANGFFPEAKSAYSDALQKNPDDLKVSTLLGMVALFSNHLDESEKYLRRAAQTGPFQTVAQNLLGELFYRRDQFPEAARWFRAEEAPSGPVLWNSLEMRRHIRSMGRQRKRGCR